MNELANDKLGRLAVDNLGETTFADHARHERNGEFTFKSGDRPLDGYTIKRGIGFGGFGEVYYALSDGGKEVALKLVQRHLDIELRGVSHCLNLKSPNLVSIFDVRQGPRGENWIIMEFMAGSSLQHEIEKSAGAMPFEEVLHWLRGIATAVDDLHQSGIVHRDLKPGNVFSEANVVKVGDYGLSKFITHSRRSGQTQSVGTVHYMAPEISTGNYGRGVDIYSAAVMAFEMLTGDVPFDGETAGEILMKHLTAAPALEKLDAKYRPIFDRALAKNPLDRFASAGDLYAAIEAIGLGRPLPEAPMPKSEGQPNEPGVRPQVKGFFGGLAGRLVCDKAGGEQRKPSPQPVPMGRPVAARAELQMSMPPLPGTLKAKRRAFADDLWTKFVAGVMSIVLPVLALSFEVTTSGKSDTHLANYASLAVLTGLASWGLMSLGNFWETARTDVANRRFAMLLFGFGLGAVAFYLNLWLDNQVPRNVRVAWQSDHGLQDLVPTLLVYLSAFGIAFVVPDWAQTACYSRVQRFSIWSVLWAGCVGLVVGNVVPSVDGEWLGSLLALTSITVQWVSPHRGKMFHVPEFA